MTLNEIYYRLQLLSSVPTDGLPGAAMAELMLLRARHARTVNDYFKLMEEAETQLKEEEKYAPLKEKEAEEYRNKQTGRFEGIEAEEGDSEEARELKALIREFEEAKVKMRMDAAEEDRYKPIGVLSEATFAAICEVAMAQRTVPGVPDHTGKRPDLPAELLLADLAAVIEADSKPKK